jgi:hypothetical protein
MPPLPTDGTPGHVGRKGRMGEKKIKKGVDKRQKVWYYI